MTGKESINLKIKLQVKLCAAKSPSAPASQNQNTLQTHRQTYPHAHGTRRGRRTRAAPKEGAVVDAKQSKAASQPARRELK